MQCPSQLQERWERAGDLLKLRPEMELKCCCSGPTLEGGRIGTLRSGGGSMIVTLKDPALIGVGRGCTTFNTIELSHPRTGSHWLGLAK